MKRNIQFVLSALAAVLLFSCSSLSVPPVPRAPGPAQPPYFRNLSEKLGLDDFAAKRATFVDADSDGWLDLFLLGSGEDGMRLFLSRPDAKGDRGLEDFTGQSGLLEAAGARLPIFVIFADVDNDGDADAFLSRSNDFEKSGKPDDGLRCEILLNDGKAVFKKLEGSGVGNHSETTSAGAFLDYDNDGSLDLVLGNWYRYYGKSLECYPDRLYRGLGGGRFEEVTEQIGMLTNPEPGNRNSSRPTYGLTHLDYNNDGYQDILVCAYGRQWNMLWENRGGEKFVEVGEKARIDGDEDESGAYSQKIKEYFKKRYGQERRDEKPFRSNGNTFDAACADYDSDGDVDVFLAEICHSWAGPSSDKSVLCENLGAGSGFAFTRRHGAVSRVHGDPERWNEGDLHAGWLDFDNDGRLDLLVASGDYPDGQYMRLFRQREDGAFDDITDKCGFDWEGCGGLTLGDFDRDGDVDILVGRSFARLPKEKREGKIPHAALFENTAGNSNNFLCVTLEGNGAGACSRGAIGARVYVKTGPLTQMREIRGGAGHCGHQNPPECHFGLGKAQKIDSVEVRWPDKTLSVQRFTDVPVNRFVKIKQGKRRPEILDFR